jgi:hypothetical protein
MPEPREAERRTTQFSTEREEPLNKTVEKATSSKRKTNAGKQQPDGNTRARRPRSGRSGSDSNASAGTRGN